MDGEVYDEVDNSARGFHIYNDVIFPARVFLLNYGWYILAAAFVLHQLFIRLIRPRLQQRQEYATVGAAKKSDADNDRYATARRAARERQQAHHDKVAAEAEAEKRRKEEEKLAKLREEMAQRSVVENALLDYKMAKDRKEREKQGKGDTDESPADFLLRVVASAPIVIVSKSFCPFSRKAKATFATYRLPRDEVVYLELDELGEKREKAVQAEMARIYGRERVPAVFISGEFIGDHEAVVTQQHEGVLDVLVKDATESWRTNKQ